MDLATIQAIASVLFQIYDFAVKYGPGIVKDFESVITDLKLAWTSATSGTPITPDQQAQIDAALDKANSSLLAAIATQQAQN